MDLPTIDQVKFLCDAGLGPIAFKMYGDEFRQSDPTLFSVLLSADLTTRVIYGQLEKAAVELTGELQGAGVIPTLLKGISTSEEFYAPPYLRLMSDIDILIKHSEIDLVMAKVADLGYVITDEQWRKYRKHGAHHLPEARHPKTGVSLEVHTSLFAPAEFYSEEYVFQPDIVAEQSVEFDYRGTRVARFTPEFQLIYTLSKWTVDESWAVKLTSINDTIHILKKYQSEFDWPTLCRWFAASPHLFPITAALLHYLEQADIVTVSPQLREALASADSQLGSRTLKVLTWLLHTYPFNARVKAYGGFSRWCALSLWLYLTNPNSRNLGIPSARLYRFYMSALYGKNNPFRRVLPGSKALVYRIRNK
ncbi:nucleotidyltransferase family protein [Gammaproteobacteria bacterium]|nr:nucleotidyltransferase family protein [Gammaproteobacteria bacterium]